MKAIVLREFGGPEKLLYEDIADPQPGDGEVVVRLRAAALNHRDYWIRTGRYANITLPIILGSDGAGTVETIGRNADRSLMGKEVVLYPSTHWDGDERAQGKNVRLIGLPENGTYAQLIRVPARCCVLKPKEISFEEAAAVPVAGLTAYRALITRAKLQSGETVLITGIGGGVALFALQIAVAIGARVLVTSGSDEKIERAKKLGASDGANYRTAQWKNTILDLTNGGGIDLVVDGAGGESFDASLDLLKPGGRLVNYGATIGIVKELQLRKIFWKQLTLLGSTLGTISEFTTLMSLYGTGNLHPIVDSVYPLSKTPEAHTKMDMAKQFGKIVLSVS